MKNDLPSPYMTNLLASAYTKAVCQNPKATIYDTMQAALENCPAVVRSCNSNPQLLKAAKEALQFIEDRTTGIVNDTKDSLRMAINKAEGK